MTDALKEKIIIQAIKCYKNREEWEDEYIQEKYDVAIEYMLENFDKYFPTTSGSGSSFTSIPAGARIKREKQEEREYEYDYDSSSITNGLSSIIEGDIILSSLLGLPLIRVM